MRGNDHPHVALNGRAVFRADDGTERDITDGVQAMYDLVTTSMNWTSGFWTADDARPVARLAELFGFADVERVKEYVGSLEFDEEREAMAAALREQGRPYDDWAYSGDKAVPHGHVWSGVNGRCVWPRCKTARESHGEP